MRPRVLGVIPARGGSKGLPGKNIRPFAGLPLIAHTIQFARLCPDMTRCIVSTDSGEITEVAKQFEADVPFQRPAALAQDETPMWDVLRHALEWIERDEATPYDLLALLDPTSPAREPSDLSEALRRLLAKPEADGIIGVSQPDFNPIWHCVIERNGWMTDLIPEGAAFTRRQDVPVVYRVNGALYLWRAEFVRTQTGNWRQAGKHLLYELPESRAMSLDTVEEFERAEALIKHGLISLPWLQPSVAQ